MSLNFDYSAVIDSKAKREKAPHELDSIIWHTMFLGLNSLATDEDVDKFYVRYVQYNRANGRNTPYFLSYEHIAMFKGLYTNASSLTDAAFAKQCRKHLEADAEIILADAKKGTAMPEGLALPEVD